MPGSSRSRFTIESLADMNLNELLSVSELESFQKAVNSYSPRCIRLHPNRLETSLPFTVSDVPWYQWGRILADSSIRPASFTQYATAAYYIQDAASLLPLALLEPNATDIICDLCASPGGKASAIAERLGKQGFLLANESIRSRVDVLRYSLAKTGNPCFAVSSYDPNDLASKLPHAFDSVLVDAPCSGQTLVARNKRDDNAFAANQIEHCSLRQRRILQSAIRMIKPGGRLVYSTCTFAIEENESQIRWLHQQYPDAWEPIEPRGLESWLSPLQAGCYRLWPHRDRCAGGFAACLRLVKEIDFEPSIPSDPVGRPRQVSLEKPKQRAILEKQKEVQEVLSTFGAFRDVTKVWRNGCAQCTTTGADQFMTDHSQMAMDPMAILIETGNHFVPTHGLAMLEKAYFTPHQTFDLDLSQAKQFAAGGSVAIASPDELAIACNGIGWAVATWNKQPLGWCKVLRNRLNNHIPPWARLHLGGSDGENQTPC